MSARSAGGKRANGMRWVARVVALGRLVAGLVSLSCLLPAAHAQQPGPVGQPAGPWREQIHWVPTQNAGGRPALLYTRICRPEGDQPAKVVLINHGKPPDMQLRDVKPAACTNAAVQWFLTRGYLVVAGLRRGYGLSQGTFAEAGGSCSAADLVRAGQEGVRDVEALLHYAQALPYARPDPAVVVGQSVGGWVSDVLDSEPHPGVGALISMAGGHGGHVHDIPNNNCRPDQLVAAAGILGQTATTPMLWIYTQNDSYFAPSLAKAMHDAFTASGGKAELLQLPAFGEDGHALFLARTGPAIWGPPMEAYLARTLTRP